MWLEEKSLVLLLARFGDNIYTVGIDAVFLKTSSLVLQS